MEIHHDPMIKQRIKDALYSFLYEPAEAVMNRKLQQIIVKNCTLLNSPHQSFIHKGNVYFVEEQQFPRQMNRLHLSLYPEMDKYLGEMKQLNEYELPYVLGFINQVLNSSSDLHDYLRVLPASIHQPIQELIASCPCRTVKLSSERVEILQQANQLPIELIKKRQVINLLL